MHHQVAETTHLLWNNEHILNLITQNRQKIVTAKWKTATAEEKKPYEGIYHAGKEAYLQVIAKEKRETDSMRFLEDEQKQRTAMELLEQYMQFKQETEKDGKKNKLHIPPFGPFFFLVWLLMCFIHVHKKEKDPLKPKHPMSAYLLFTNDRRAAFAAENNNLLEVAKITSEEWKNMTEEQKRPYEEKKDEEAGHFMKEEEDHMKLQKQQALQLLKKKEKTENIIKIIVLEDTKEYISYVSKEEAKTQHRRPADLLKALEATQQGQVSRSYAVYCLGIVIIEILTARFRSQYVSNGKGGVDVVQWVETAISEGHADRFSV
ncbi:hypothetical protein JHK84_028344 [Glycine max]|nr:hypothetical protein JHK84_028344 [Glycine max]